VREGAEAQRRLDVRIARGHQPRDRDGHVRAQQEHRAVVVEEPVDAVAAGHPAHDRLVLDRRRPHLAVAEALEHGAHRLGDRTQLAHLVGQDVAGPGGDRVHRAHQGPEIYACTLDE
jgi:hypothetical protein